MENDAGPVKAACGGAGRGPIRSSMADDRERRLAEALRANLRRRKAQARESRTGDTDTADPAPSPPERGDAG